MDPKENRDVVTHHYTKYLEEFHHFKKMSQIYIKKKKILNKRNLIDIEEEGVSPQKTKFLSNEKNKIPTNCEYVFYHLIINLPKII